MSLKTKNNLFQTFSFRLTAGYALLFVSSLAIVFFISYKILLSDLLHVVDRSLYAQTARIEDNLGKEELPQVITEIRESIEEEGKNRIFYRLLKSNLDVVTTSDPLKWPCLNFPQMSQWAHRASGSNSIYSTIKPSDRNYKVRILSRGIDEGKYIVQIGKTMSDEEELAAVYRKVFGGAVLVLLFCGVFLAWLEAQRAMRRIEELMQSLKDVTNNIAHDLRTPITRIRGMAETDYQQSQGAIIEECDRLVGVINTMLAIAEADAGLKKVQCVALDIVTLVRQGCEIFELVAQDKNITLNFKSEQPSLIVSGDAPRLQRVVSNLLDNAVKFTPVGGSITVSLTQETKHAFITVADTGIGISPENQLRIFEKFYRVDTSRTNPGNGLGLSYIQSMVQALGGRVTVKSSLGQGSSFIVILPLA